MTDHSLQVVQFVHPGFEYHRREHVGTSARRSGVMGWKAGRSKHDRKFMLARGSFFDPRTNTEHTSVPVGLWGEWEGPSVFWKVDSPGKPLPSIVHAPYRPAEPPLRSVQNTDPMVFGNSFIYSNCLQATYRSLRSLLPGSIILFGRYRKAGGRPSFSLDTCLVVERVETLLPAPLDPEGYGQDLLEDAVLAPLDSEDIRTDLSVYFGRGRSSQESGPFSFFPAQLMNDSPPLFARPELHPRGALEGVISPGNMQGIKLTSGLMAVDRDAIWEEAVQQVAAQGCGLGHGASPPPVLDDHGAKRASQESPLPLAY